MGSTSGKNGRGGGGWGGEKGWLKFEIWCTLHDWNEKSPTSLTTVSLRQNETLTSFKMVMR